MAITVVPSVVTGQTYSAANFNTHIRDNINGIWVLTTAGDMLYATGASAAARLALVPGGVMYAGASAPVWLPKPASLGILQNDAAGVPSYFTGGQKYDVLRKNAANGALEWGSHLLYRQSGGDVIWTAPGPNTYAVHSVVEQSGYASVDVIAGVGVKAVTYPVSFAGLTNERPRLTLTPEISSSQPYAWGVGHSDDTLTGFSIHLKFGGSITATFSVGWVATSGISTFIS